MRKLINKILRKLGYVPANDVRYKIVRVRPEVIKVRVEHNVPLSRVANAKDPELMKAIIKNEVNQKLLGMLTRVIRYETHTELLSTGSEQYVIKAKLNIVD
jgi:hypothetical protein